MPFIKALIQATCLVFYIVEYVCLTCIFSLAKLLHATFMGPTPILLLILHIESKNTTKITFEFAFVIVFIAPEDIHLFVFFMYCVVICIRCFTQTSFNCGLVSRCKFFLFKLEEGNIWPYKQIYLAQFSEYMAAILVDTSCLNNSIISGMMLIRKTCNLKP